VTCRFQDHSIQLQASNSFSEPENPILMGKENRYAGALEEGSRAQYFNASLFP
jgi:hypothetical protein